MKPNQNVSTTLVVLQICMVLLLGVTAILSYQNQAEVQGLRNDLAKIRESWGSADQQSLDARMAELELKAGLRDPKAAQASEALSAEMAQANALKQRFDQLREGGSTGTAAPADASSANTLFPRPKPTNTPTTTETAPVAAPQGLTPAEQAIAALPVVAEISEHEPAWGFYMINRGQLDGIRASHEYGVRKKDGYTLLANLKVSRLHPQDAVAELVPDTQKEGAPTPTTGDLLVDISKLK